MHSGEKKRQQNLGTSLKLSHEAYCSCLAPRLRIIFKSALFPGKTLPVGHHVCKSPPVVDEGWWLLRGVDFGVSR